MSRAQSLVTAAIAMAVSSGIRSDVLAAVSPGPLLRNLPPRPDPAMERLRREVAEHNAAVEAKKAAKRARRQQKKEHPHAQ